MTDSQKLAAAIRRKAFRARTYRRWKILNALANEADAIRDLPLD